MHVCESISLAQSVAVRWISKYEMSLDLFLYLQYQRLHFFKSFHFLHPVRFLVCINGLINRCVFIRVLYAEKLQWLSMIVYAELPMT